MPETISNVCRQPASHNGRDGLQIMPKFETFRRVKHAAGDMFDLVADVEKYPGFVPLCSKLSVKSHRTLESGRQVLVADMTVSYKVIQETFATKVTLDRERGEILVEYLDGPFRHLENKWSFKEIEPSVCDVGFYISYEFKSRMLAGVAGAVFDKAFRKFSSAFEARADEVYGAAV